MFPRSLHHLVKHVAIGLGDDDYSSCFLFIAPALRLFLAVIWERANHETHWEQVRLQDPTVECAAKILRSCRLALLGVILEISELGEVRRKANIGTGNGV